MAQKVDKSIMSKDRLDDNYISKMMEETYKFLPENDSAKDSKDLFVYFKKQYENEISDHSPESPKAEIDFFAEREGDKYRLIYREGQQCFRLDLGYHILDIPRNWFLFERVFEEMHQGDEELLVLKRCQDHQFFLKVIPGVGSKEELVFVKNDTNEIWMYVLSAHEVNKLLSHNKKGASKETPYIKAA